MNFSTIILAAGKGTRMKSNLAKVLHPINNKPMIHYVISQAESLQSDPIVLVIGHQKDQVMEETQSRNVQYAIQDNQLGTGHAVQQAEQIFTNYDGAILVLSGDVPLLTESTLKRFSDNHFNTNATASVLTAKLEDPTGYGRVVRNSSGKLKEIVEHKDASEDILKINEINTGIYIFDAKHLFRILKLIKNDNAQGEYYLPDVLPLLINENHSVEISLTDDFDETRGINTIEQLKDAEKILMRRNG